MADGLRLETDTAGLLRALDRLDATLVERYTRPACKVTAERVQAAARARVRRRTGRTAAGISVEESRDQQGYVVLPFDAAFETALIQSGNNQQPENLPYWLEFGTKKMAKRPYFFAGVDLERGPHDRRIREAVQDAIDASGLGDA